MEIEILNFINDNLHSIDFINNLAKFISLLCDNGYIWLGLGAFLMIFKKTKKAGFLVLCGAGATLIINSLILKNIFNRIRPFVENPEFVTFIESLGIHLPTDSSFPSGHTFVSFCCSIILCLNLKKKWPFIYIYSTLVALSRVFLCVHYPTDILAGALIGTLVGIGIHYLSLFVVKHIKNPNP